jgi:hypothetical protein
VNHPNSLPATPSSLRNIYETYIRFLHIHIAMCVPSLVEIAPSVPELCPDTHTHTHTHTNTHTQIYIYIYTHTQISIFIGIDITYNNNIGRGEEELLRWRTNNCFVNYTHATGSNTTVTTIRDSHGNHNSWILIQLTVMDLFLWGTLSDQKSGL